MEEAKAAAVRSDEAEESACRWSILRTPSEWWLLGCGETWKREAAERRTLDCVAEKQGIPTIEIVKRIGLEKARKVAGNPDDR